MENIDLKDRKILYQLDLNCRQSNTKIGKKVGLKKDVVSYRIKRLQDIGVITNFWTSIDTFKLGYDVFRIYINFQYINKNIKEEIVKHFVAYENLWAAFSVRADIDFDAIIWVDDVYEFYQFWNKTLDKFEDYFERYIISIYVEAFCYTSSFLLPETNNGSDRLLSNMKCGGKAVKIDQTDYKLLNEIALNARIPLIELAEKLNCSSQTVNYRLKNLKKSGVINGFRVGIDLSKIGLKEYKIDIFLKDHHKRKAICEYMKEKPYLTYLNVAVGWSDLEFEVVVENFDELGEIMDEINMNFPNSIKKQNFWITEEVHKVRFLPEL